MSLSTGSRAAAGWLVSLLSFAALGACTTTRKVEPAGLANAQAQHLLPERAWQVVDDGESRGVIVLFVSPAEAGAPRSLFYSVQNPRRQELGMIDAQGRAWRYEVHQREARWISTGTLLDGARAILGAQPGAVLVEQPVDNAGAGTSAQ